MLRHSLPLVLLAIPSLATAATLTVDPDGNGDYTHLQDAVQAAQDGDELLLMPGEHFAASVSQKSLTLTGQNDTGEVIVSHVTVSGSGDLTVSNVEFTNSNGRVEADGGMLYLDNVSFLDDSSRTLHQVLVAENDAEVTVNGSTFSGLASVTSVIEVTDSLLTLSDTIVDQCQGYGDGTISAVDSDLYVVSSELAETGTYNHGGAIRQDGGTLSISDSIFGASSAPGYGGHIYADSLTSLSVADSSFSDGEAQDGGGAITMVAVDDASFSNVLFSDNFGTRGGAIFGYASNWTAEDVAMDSNGAVEGGQVAVNGGTVSLVRVMMDKGLAYYGPGLAIMDGDVTATNIAIVNQKAASDGSAIYMEDGTLDVDYAVLFGNHASSAPVIAVDGGDISLTGIILTCNTGGAPMEYRGQGTAVYRDSIIHDDDGDAITGSAIQGPNVLDTNAMFIDPDNKDYALNYDSPGIDAVRCQDADPDGTACDMGMFGGPEAWELPDADEDGFIYGRDCNDGDASVNEDAQEIPNDGIDNNCNGSDLY